MIRVRRSARCVLYDSTRKSRVTGVTLARGPAARPRCIPPAYGSFRASSPCRIHQAVSGATTCKETPLSLHHRPRCVSPSLGPTRRHGDRCYFVLPGCVSSGYTTRMIKDSGLRIRIQRDLRDRFLQACRAEDKPAAQVLREFMRAYVDRHEGALDGPAINQQPSGRGHTHEH